MLFAHFSYCEQLTTDEILGVPYRQFYTIPYIFVKTLWQIFSHVRCFSFEPAEPLVEVLQLAVDGGQVPCQDLLHLLVDLNLASLQIETDVQSYLFARSNSSPADHPSFLVHLSFRPLGFKSVVDLEWTHLLLHTLFCCARLRGE